MKIGVLIPEFPGQTHSFFWREIQHAQTLGLQTEILSTRVPPQPVAHDWARNATADYLYPLSLKDVALICLALPVRLPRLLLDRDTWALLGTLRIWALIILAIKLGQRTRTLGLAHLHVHSCADSALIAALCHRMYALPYSLVLHGPLHDYGPHQPYKWARAEFVFVITEKLAAEMKTQMPEHIDRMQIVPMGVDTDVFSPAPAKDPDSTGPFIWFSCARLNRVKGFETLIKAAAVIAKTHPDLDLRIRIAGEDEQGGTGYRKVLEALITEHDLSEKVVLLGAITQEKVLENLRNSDAFVLASRHEPLGVAYMEAMACGLPTIGTDAGGVRELIEHEKSGLLVAPDDPQALGDMMCRVMLERDLRQALAEGGRDRIVRAFSSTRSAQALAEALHRP